MTSRKVLVYYAWSRRGEIDAPLEVIENRFPALFESRRLGFPRFEEMADPARFDQGIAGFLDHIMKENFTTFVELAASHTGQAVVQVERGTDDGGRIALDERVLSGVDTLIVLSFDSLRTGQSAEESEVRALRDFLAHPDHLAFVCPHHDIGNAPEESHEERVARQVVEFLHHGDRSIPPQQRFGGFARSVLAGLGVPVENRFGLRPSVEPDGSASPIEVESALDRLGLLEGVGNFNLHPHLPHLDRLDEARRGLMSWRDKESMWARRRILLLQDARPSTRCFSREPGCSPGTLLVGDTTLWSSTAGGVTSLRRLWTNVLDRPGRS